MVQLYGHCVIIHDIYNYLHIFSVSILMTSISPDETRNHEEVDVHSGSILSIFVLQIFSSMVSFLSCISFD